MAVRFFFQELKGKTRQANESCIDPSVVYEAEQSFPDIDRHFLCLDEQELTRPNVGIYAPETLELTKKLKSKGIGKTPARVSIELSFSMMHIYLITNLLIRFSIF